MTSFYSAFLNIHYSGVVTALAWLVPRETAAVTAQVLCTPYNHAPCHFMQSHIRKVYSCLAVTATCTFGRKRKKERKKDRKKERKKERKIRKKGRKEERTIERKKEKKERKEER